MKSSTRLLSSRWARMTTFTVGVVLLLSLSPMTTSRRVQSADAATVSAGRTRRTTTMAQQHHGHSTCGHPTIPTTRRACGFYVWDAPSALLYKWCHYLLKDHIYEGKGGYLASHPCLLTVNAGDSIYCGRCVSSCRSFSHSRYRLMGQSKNRR